MRQSAREIIPFKKSLEQAFMRHLRVIPQMCVEYLIPYSRQLVIRYNIFDEQRNIPQGTTKIYLRSTEILILFFSQNYSPRTTSDPGRDYQQGAPTFLREKRGAKSFLGEINGGEDFFKRKKKGTGTYSEGKKEGRKLFSL